MHFTTLFCRTRKKGEYYKKAFKKIHFSGFCTIDALLNKITFSEEQEKLSINVPFLSPYISNKQVLEGDHTEPRTAWV